MTSGQIIHSWDLVCRLVLHSTTRLSLQFRHDKLFEKFFRAIYRHYRTLTVSPKSSTVILANEPSQPIPVSKQKQRHHCPSDRCTVSSIFTESRWQIRHETHRSWTDHKFWRWLWNAGRSRDRHDGSRYFVRKILLGEPKIVGGLGIVLHELSSVRKTREHEHSKRFASSAFRQPDDVSHGLRVSGFSPILQHRCRSRDYGPYRTNTRCSVYLQSMKCFVVRYLC